MHQKFRLCDILSERYLTQEILIFLGYCLNCYKITHYKGLIMYKILLFITLTFSSNTVFSATFEVEMLNRLGKESMVYSQNIVNVKAGDTVKWISASKGHNVQFLTVPEGVDPFRSKLSVDTEYTFTIPGIYLYQCTPHKSMGMIAVVVVDANKDNFDAISSTRVGGKSKKRLAQILDTLNS